MDRACAVADAAFSRAGAGSGASVASAPSSVARAGVSVSVGAAVSRDAARAFRASRLAPSRSSAVGAAAS
eukprot:2756709-Alexandrium_andersonii.AAC.1